MKKALITALLAIFISCLFFSFVAESSETACPGSGSESGMTDPGSDDFAPGERSTHLWFDQLNSAEHPDMLKYRTVMDLGMGEEMTTVTVNIEDQATRCVDLHAKSHSVGVLSVSGDTTVRLHDEAVYVRVKAPALNVPRIGPQQTMDGEADPKDYLRATGTGEIEGKEYDYEEMVFYGNDVQTFYFDTDTSKWRYWKTRDKTLEILAYEQEVSPKAFLVPAWYTEVKDVNGEIQEK